MSSTSKIFSETIHHVQCVGCDKQGTTADWGRPHYRKTEAAAGFISNGWQYIIRKGWLCPECNGSLERNMKG